MNTGTIKSLRRERFVTAYEIAKAKGYEDLISILEPRIHHSVPEDTLVKLEQQVHDLLRRLEGNKVGSLTSVPSLRNFSQLVLPLRLYPNLWRVHTRSKIHLPDRPARRPPPPTFRNDRNVYVRPLPLGTDPYNVWRKSAPSSRPSTFRY